MHDPNHGTPTLGDSYNRGRLTAAAGILLAALLCVGLVLPVPHLGRTLCVFFDMMHGPTFALFAALLVFALPKRTTLQTRLVAVGVWILIVGLGLLSEIVQSFIGRSASWHDVAANTLGASAGVLWAVTRTSRSRRVRRRSAAVALFLLCAASARAPIILMDCIVQQMEKPLLASFERPLEMIRWEWHDCDVSRVTEHATHGRFSVRLDQGEKRCFGIYSRALFFDWSVYKTLAFDITVVEAKGPPNSADGDAEVNLIVRMHDSAHTCDPHDRFERQFRLAPGLQTIEIPLAEVYAAPQGRKMNLSRLSFIHLLFYDAGRPCVIYLDNFRLQ